jgi:hypothetical protein
MKVKNINPAHGAAHRHAHPARRSGPAGRQSRLGGGLLREATALEDGFNYDEPHLWLAPTRQALGAALLAAGQAAGGRAGVPRGPGHYPANGGR